MIRIELHQSPVSIFKHDIEGISFDAPDQFRPVVGEQIRFDLFRPRGRPVGRLNGPAVFFVTKVEWRLEYVGPNERDNDAYTATLSLTVASEMPAKPGTRRKHEDKP